MARRPFVGIAGFEDSTVQMLQHTADTLTTLQVPHEWKILSAHHHPDGVKEYAESAWERGLRIVVAGEKGAAHLAGMIKAFADAIAVLAVLETTDDLRGIDSVASAVNMPKGVPVAIMGFDKPGAVNAGVFSADVLADRRPTILAALRKYRGLFAEQVAKANEQLGTMSLE